MNKNYAAYHTLLKKIADINNAQSLLSWDQETYMPAKSNVLRAQQLSTLAGVAHQLATSPELGAILDQLQTDQNLSEKEKRNVAQSVKDYNIQKKYPTAFVEEMSRLVSEAFQAWQKARSENNFSAFAPTLHNLVTLKRQECELLGYTDHPYDALIDLYEPGTTTKDITLLFTAVKEQLVSFVKQINPTTVNNSCMFGHYDPEKQWEFGIDLLKDMGFDFEAGRQDRSIHPFTTSFSPTDVRVTTRINPNDLAEMIWSCIHEGGHALYEQGLIIDDYGLPTSQPISLGIHESQSRLWENNVGRSMSYWKYHYPRLQQLFAPQLDAVTVTDFYAAMNKVSPSFIRTSADELTYHFHVMIRFELEKQLIEGALQVTDLREAWNQKYKDYLGITVPDDKQGVLQDVHWSHGSFGYFPTYSLGSFYAAQFFTQACKQVPGLVQEIEKGNTAPLLAWLRKNIHNYGKYYTARELCLKVTGEPLSFSYFMEYAKTKYKEIYHF
jgi:carboxypeptidase Taq